MCEFTIEIEGSVAEALERARKAVADGGGELEGDETAGSFRGSTPLGAVAGGYAVSGQSIAFKIERKPMLVACSRIEKEVREFFGA